MGDGRSVLEVRDVVKSYGSRRALAGVSLAVAAGEIVGLLGPNGAGKTTLVSIVAGLRQADAGEVLVDGIDARAHPRRARRSLGVAPQETGVYPTLTCGQNLQLFGELAGLRRAELRRATDAVSEALDLVHLLDRRAQELSGGERRRLHTALALVHRPALVLLDEPTVGADVETRARLLQHVRDLAADGAAVVYSSHYLTEIEQLEASVVILEHGRAVARGRVPELVAAHASGIVEMTFGGPAPHLAAPPGTRLHVDGSVLRVHAPDPGATAACLLEELGGRARELRSLDVIQPSLETVFLRLTGRRFEPTGSAAPAELAGSAGVS